MRETTEPAPNAGLIDDLNHLLRLDHEAVQAYGVAIDALKDEEQKRELIRYRGDHQRHIVGLARLIREYRGEPLDPRELPAGAFQWGIQAVAGLGGDREVLCAFRYNEEQLQSEYRRVTRRLPEEVAERVRPNVLDEDRHLAWARDALARCSTGAAS